MPDILPTIELNLTKEHLKEKVKTRVLNWVETEHVNKAVELYLQSLKLIDNEEQVYAVRQNFKHGKFHVFLERKPNE